MAQFYEKLLEQPQLLERYNVTLAELEQAQGMVISFAEAQHTQTKKKGEAQRNTALEDDKKLLEVLGIVVPQRKNMGVQAPSTPGEVAAMPPHE